MKRLLPHLPSLAAGVVFGLAQAPFSLLWIGLLGLIAQVVITLRFTDPRSATLSGWMFGFGYFALTLHWIIEPFLVDAARHGWMAPFAWVFLAGGLALFWGAAQLVAFKIASGSQRSTFVYAIIWATSLAGAEMLRSYVFTGFPWNLPAYIWADRIVAQSVAWIGPHGLTLVTLLVAALVGWALQVGGKFRAATGVMLGGVVLLSGGASPDLFLPEASTDQERPLIRIVQPNAPQSEKWHPDKIQGFFDTSVRLTAGGDSAPDLIVWPETSVPVWLHRAETAFDIIRSAAKGAPVVVGIQRSENLSYYNSAALLEGAQVAALYDKSHLVPFGEYVPFGNLFSRMGIYGLAANEGGGYSAGKGPDLFDIKGIGTAQPLICYEGIFPNLVGATSTRADLLLLITNDAWFGNWAGPRQHLVQAQFRSIEQGLPMVRAANTGISAMIDPFGRVTDQLTLNTSGALDAYLPAPLAPTLYSRYGDKVALFLILVLLVSGGVAQRARRAFVPH